MQLADLPPVASAQPRRFSSTQAVFQFAALTFLTVAVTLVAGASAFDGLRPGFGRLLLLAACVSLIIPAALAAGLVIETITRGGTERPSALAWRLKLVVLSFGLSMVLFLGSAVLREQTPQQTLLDTQRENARFLFGLDDLTSMKLVNYLKSNDRVEAEFSGGGRSISLIVKPDPKPAE